MSYSHQLLSRVVCLLELLQLAVLAVYLPCGLGHVAHVSHMVRMLCTYLIAEPDLSCLDHNYFLGEVGRFVGTAAGAAAAAAIIADEYSA
jgi:hypothetical protein